MLASIKKFIRKILGKQEFDPSQIQSEENLKAKAVEINQELPVQKPAIENVTEITPLNVAGMGANTPEPDPNQMPASTPPEITKQPFNETFPQQTSKSPPIVTLILDGWGIGPDYPGNAITQAATPNLDNYWLSFPHTQLVASGQAVGLPKGQDGNTETGHLNIGAGSIVYQELARIDNAIADGSFAQNPIFANTFAHVKKHNSTLHLMGLVSGGKVHSNTDHLYALLDMCNSAGIKIIIHAFTDGRDAPPNTGIDHLKTLQTYLKKTGVGKIGSLAGRFWAMDRDRKWDRIEKVYNMMTIGCNNVYHDPIEAIDASYKQQLMDEFVEPCNIANEDGSLNLINDNDAVIFFNFRVDRPRELTRAFVMPDFEQGIKQESYDPHIEEFHKTSLYKEEGGQTFKRQKVLQNLFFVTMTTYEDVLPVEVAFKMQTIRDDIGSVLSGRGLRQLRITETEKGKFVTEYMNAQRKTPHPGEDWIIYPSKGVKSYDEIPAMSTPEISRELINQLAANRYDVIMSNICNGDMIGHTGNIQAAIKACELVDQHVGLIVNQVLAKNGTVIITADHGNAEEMINVETGEIDTEHSIYPVPFMIINNSLAGKPLMLPTGILADIAPTMLHLLGISKPEGMTGQTLFNQSLL